MPIPLVTAAIGALAPTLAQKGLDLLSAVFTGGVTKGAEQVASLIEEKTGITVRDIAENRLDDAQWQQLREFEAQNKQAILAAQVQFDTNDVERERVAAADRNSARVLQQAAMTSGDKTTAWFHNFLTTLLILLAFGFLYWAAFWHNYTTDPGSKDLINTILGFLFTVLAAVVAFHYGTTSGSKRKDDRAVQLTEIIASGKDGKP